MLKKKTFHPPLNFWNSTPSSTPELSPTSSSSDSDSDEDMDPSSGSRPNSLTVTTGAFCPMRPSLADVLSDTARPPYTLSAFMAYLSQNHCLETLEFTMEAKRYRESYDSLTRNFGGPPPTDNSVTQHLRMLWQRLLMAYIFPGAPREINLPSNVRDDLLRHSDLPSPPPPQTLDTSVKLIHDLMEESIFLPFLNSHSTPTQSTSFGEQMYSGDEGVSVVSSSGLDDHAPRRVRSKAKRLSPQSSFGDLMSPFSERHSGRSNFPLSAIATLGKGHSRGSGPVSNASVESGTLTDDSGSLQSSISAGEPMTPPTTPPSGEPHIHMAQSPRYRAENPWKKMGMKLGFKKRPGSGSSSSRDLDD